MEKRRSKIESLRTHAGGHKSKEVREDEDVQACSLAESGFDSRSEEAQIYTIKHSKKSSRGRRTEGMRERITLWMEMKVYEKGWFGSSKNINSIKWLNAKHE